MIEFESLFDCSNIASFSKKMKAKTKEEQLDFKINCKDRLTLKHGGQHGLAKH